MWYATYIIYPCRACLRERGHTDTSYTMDILRWVIAPGQLELYVPAMWLLFRLRELKKTSLKVLPACFIVVLFILIFQQGFWSLFINVISDGGAFLTFSSQLPLLSCRADCPLCCLVLVLCSYHSRSMTPNSPSEFSSSSSTWLIPLYFPFYLVLTDLILPFFKSYLHVVKESAIKMSHADNFHRRDYELATLDLFRFMSGWVSSVWVCFYHNA